MKTKIILVIAAIIAISCLVGYLTVYPEWQKDRAAKKVKWEEAERKHNELNAEVDAVLEKAAEVLVEVESFACIKFISERFSPSETPEVLDHWKKGDLSVYEMGYKKDKYDKSYSVRLCVYDIDNGRVKIPSVYNESRYFK